MSDIVERLRRGWGFCTSDDTEDAAAEIERLRAEKAHWEHIYQALDADRARLREALGRAEEIARAIRAEQPSAGGDIADGWLPDGSWKP